MNDDIGEVESAGRVLLTEAERKPLWLIRQTTLAVKPACDHFLGITQIKFITLYLLHSQGEMSQTEIQQRLGVDRAMITRLVKQLEVDGFVKRRINPVDHRFTLVRLSDAGRDLFDTLITKIQELDLLLLRGVSVEEFACFQHVLDRIRTNAEDILRGVKIQSSTISENLLD